MPPWGSRLLLTVIVVAGAAHTVRFVSATADAVERISVTEQALAELAQYIAGVHASNRERFGMPDEPAAPAMVEFDATFDRGLARLNTLTADMTAATAHVGGWAGGFMPSGAGADGLRAIDVERRAYAQAVATAATGGTTPYQPSGVRLLDLQAQKLLASISAQRESAGRARAGALQAAETTVGLSLPAAALLLGYLIWRAPVSPGADGSSS